jgi:hypothetical protein
MEPSFPEKAVPAEGFAPRKQWEAALEATLWLRANLDEAGRKEQSLLMLGDGDFSVAELRAQLPEEGVLLMSRCAKNRALYELPEECTRQEGPKERGRRRKYGDRAISLILNSQTPGRDRIEIRSRRYSLPQSSMVHQRRLRFLLTPGKRQRQPRIRRDCDRRRTQAAVLRCPPGSQRLAS